MPSCVAFFGDTLLLSQFGLDGHKLFGYLDQLKVFFIVVTVLIITIFDVPLLVFEVRRIFNADPVLLRCWISIYVVRVVGTLSFDLGRLGCRRFVMDRFFHNSIRIEHDVLFNNRLSCSHNLLSTTEMTKYKEREPTNSLLQLLMKAPKYLLIFFWNKYNENNKIK